ncbi:MAG TPA: winged helix DNA-binding domain-containing protein, partial [Candidatus Limnocylindrales bacterium]|nr:winged helix DNA-binding domain-containing protein [Candidatus Limnocylindrales bacterium]
AGMMTGRTAVRAPLMRDTLHLVTAADFVGLRPVFVPLLARRFRGSPFFRNLAGVDQDAVAEVARVHLEAGPKTAAELGRLLAEQWPGRDPLSLAMVVRPRLALVQIPPRGVWGSGGLPTWALAEDWLGRRVGTDARPDRLVRRYLAALGPATIADIQNWSGLSGIRTVVERLRDELLVFHDERGRALYDVPEAPRPDPGTPAPPRYLPEYDNLLLGHHDRTRVMAVEHKTPLFPGSGGVLGSVLLDGRFAGGWQIVRGGRSDPSSVSLKVDLLAPASATDRRALATEGEQLLAFAAAGAKVRDVVIGGGG